MLACKGSAEVSFFACAAQQSLWHCMEACHALVSVRGERRKTDESAALSLHPHTHALVLLDKRASISTFAK